MSKQGRFALLAVAPWALAWTLTFALLSTGGPRQAAATLAQFFFWYPNIAVPLLTYAGCNVVWLVSRQHRDQFWRRDRWVVGAGYAAVSSVLVGGAALAVDPSIAAPAMTWVVVSGYWAFAWVLMAWVQPSLARQ